MNVGNGLILGKRRQLPAPHARSGRLQVRYGRIERRPFAQFRGGPGGAGVLHQL